MYYDSKRLALNIFWLVLGLTLIALSVAEIIDNSMYATMGGGFAAVGAIRIAMTVRYRKDAAYREKTDTAVNDERNQFLHMKSWAWTGYVVVLALGIGTVFAMFFGEQTIQLALAYSLCAILVIYWIAFLILKRKY